MFELIRKIDGRISIVGNSLIKEDFKGQSWGVDFESAEELIEVVEHIKGISDECEEMGIEELWDEIFQIKRNGY